MRWIEAVALRLYSCAMQIAQPLLRIKLKSRARNEPTYGLYLEQRWGDYTALPNSARNTASNVDAPWIWVHAVSLGETRAVQPFMKALRQSMPGARLLLTHGTASGFEAGSALLEEGDCQTWYPWDTPQATQLFLNQFQPVVGLLMETEVWPNMVYACRHMAIPLFLVNGRMSDKSLKQGLRLRWLSRPAYSNLTGVYAQSPTDAAAFTRLGAKIAGIQGNFKFDAKPNRGQLSGGQNLHQLCRKPVIALASSREGEEIQLLAFLKNSPLLQSAHWLLIPRHPQRFDAVEQLCTSHGFVVSRRSACQNFMHEGFSSADIWLADSLGEMPLYYGLADVALLGGSFVNVGGQNLIEAAACACPVLMGMSTFNFARAAEDAIKAGAAIRYSDMLQALGAAVELAYDTERLTQMQVLSQAFASQHQGAVARTVLDLAKRIDVLSIQRV